MDREAATLEVKARLNIVDVIGRYIPLERSGRNYKGLCPFHRENQKNNSIIVLVVMLKAISLVLSCTWKVGTL